MVLNADTQVSAVNADQGQRDAEGEIQAATVGVLR